MYTMAIDDNIIIPYQVAVDNIDQVAVDKVDPLVDQYILALGWQEVGNPQDQVEVVVDSFVDPEKVDQEHMDMVDLVELEDTVEMVVEGMVCTAVVVDQKMVLRLDQPYFVVEIKFSYLLTFVMYKAHHDIETLFIQSISLFPNLFFLSIGSLTSADFSSFLLLV